MFKHFFRKLKGNGYRTELLSPRDSVNLSARAITSLYWLFDLVTTQQNGNVSAVEVQD